MTMVIGQFITVIMMGEIMGTYKSEIKIIKLDQNGNKIKRTTNV